MKKNTELIIDADLRNSIRELGIILGKVLIEQEGQRIFNIVEDLRKSSKNLRSGDEINSQKRIHKIVDNLDVESAQKVVKAFYIYFLLVNAADEVYQIIKSAKKEKTEGSWEYLIEKLKKEKIGEKELEQLLNRIEIIPVFTAHPTEATRQTILRRMLEISELLLIKHSNSKDPFTVEKLDRDIYAAVVLLWQTDEIRSRKVTVADEVQHGMFFFKEILYNVIPDLHMHLNYLINRDMNYHVDTSAFIKFGSWMGGDRDGHPFVTQEITKSTLINQRKTIIGLYLNELNQLYGKLSPSIRMVKADKIIYDIVKRNRSLLYEYGSLWEHRNPNEIYRSCLLVISAKLKRSLLDDKGGYKNSADFITDLKHVNDSLIKNKGGKIAKSLLQPLMYKIETFGFHTAALDIRQNSSLLRSAVEQIFRSTGIAQKFGNLSEENKVELLTREILNPRPLVGRQTVTGKLTRQVLDEFELIKWGRENISPKAVKDYIISNCNSISDILSALLLAKEAGCIKLGKRGISNSLLDILPLFETIEDLRNAPLIMIKLFENRAYSMQIKARNNTQLVMLGYSDSNKDGGIFCSNYELYKAQIRLKEITSKNKIELILFHGRGGSISRGGGPVYQSILSEPRGTIGGRIKLTEQGEMISSKYLIPEIAERSLEYISSAVILSAVYTQKGKYPEMFFKYEKLFSKFSEYSFQYYRELLENEKFTEYFRTATPIDIVENIEIGSRPSSRKKGADFKSLRAIPWVFSWTQNRQTISGWFGFGYAVQRCVDEGITTWQQLNSIFKSWNFFNTLVQNIEMVLFKTDMIIAKEYSTLCGNDKYLLGIFNIIREEYYKSVNAVLKINGEQNLLDANPRLQQSLFLRNPYTDPVSFIQVKFLKKFRSKKISGKQREKIFSLLRSSVNGIASGLKNTG